MSVAINVHHLTKSAFPFMASYSILDTAISDLKPSHQPRYFSRLAKSDDRDIFLVQTAAARDDLVLQDEVYILGIPRPRDLSKGTLDTPQVLRVANRCTKNDWKQSSYCLPT
jgi:hypothetical protein